MIKKAKNKKVKNATKCEHNLISFKSKLELFAYKAFIEAGFRVGYEQEKFILQEKFRYNGELIREITFTPDFTILYNNTLYYVEAKGMITDSFNLKKKMFLKLLNDKYENPPKFFMPRNQKNVIEVINIIKNN